MIEIQNPILWWLVALHVLMVSVLSLNAPVLGTVLADLFSEDVLTVAFCCHQNHPEAQQKTVYLSSLQNLAVLWNKHTHPHSLPSLLPPKISQDPIYLPDITAKVPPQKKTDLHIPSVHPRRSERGRRRPRRRGGGGIETQEGGRIEP